MFRQTFECMGTIFAFQILDGVGEAEASRLCSLASEILTDADSTFSLYKLESETSRLNTGSLKWSEASPAQLQIHNEAERWKEATDGFFDAVDPTGVYDPSGIVKSWAARNAAGFLEANGIRNFTLNAGGDIHLGPDVTRPPLSKVGLSNLRSIASSQAGVNMVIDLADSEYRAVATSGSAERGEHIWREDRAAKVLQVTVSAKDLVFADVWATALVSGGEAALQKFQETVDPGNASALVTFQDGGIRATAGFSALLADL